MVGLDPAPGGANSYETAAGPAATAANSANRSALGVDTDNNSADFTLAAPSPAACGCVAAGGSFTGTIAEIQGTNTDTSPRLDDTVTTTGVVTARYPSGGFAGFFMQTDGTGVGDATPGASDGIFVFLGTANAASAPALGAKVEVTGTGDGVLTVSPRSARPARRTSSPTAAGDGRDPVVGGVPDHQRWSRGPRG